MSIKDNHAVVFSFPRSGTHWFCSLLKQWFYNGVILDGEVVDSPEIEFYGYGYDPNNPRLISWASLIGGHFYNPSSISVKRKLVKHPGIYLHRDGKDVMVSLWKMDQLKSKQLGIDEISLSRYLRENIHRVADYPKENPIPVDMPVTVFWWWSFLEWSLFPNVLHVRYEDLLSDLNNQRNRIASYLKLEPSNLEISSETPVGFVPRKSKAYGSRWMKYFNDDDLILWENSREEAAKFVGLK